MAIYTDIADELYGPQKGQIPSGVKMQTAQSGNIKVTRVQISRTGLERPAGRYSTIELPAIAVLDTRKDQYIQTIAQELRQMLPETGPVLVVGVGNRNITADALGPYTAEHILVTRGFEQTQTAALGLREVAAIAPGVSAKTGLSMIQLLAGIVRTVKPAAIVCVDSLCTAQQRRLGCTVQISDTGLRPARPQSNRCITRAMLGVPVLAIGIPTMMEAEECEQEESELIVIPRRLDSLITKGAALLALSINKALQPQFSVEELNYLAN